MKKYLIGLLTLVVALGAVAPVSAAGIASRVKGRILLQVQSHGEAWYVDPVDLKRTYLKDGATAFQLLRNKGLGITNADLKKIPIGFGDAFGDAHPHPSFVSPDSYGVDQDKDNLAQKYEESIGTDPDKKDSDGDGYNDFNEITNGYDPLGPGKLPIDARLVSRLQGRILLQIQSRGEAWYLNPVDGKRYYLPNGEVAYDLMRYLSLGITNADLDQISRGDEIAGWKTYVNEKYGYSLDIPSNFKVYTEGYDNDGIEDESTVWVGTKSDFWTDGFYVRIISDLDARMNEVQQNVAEVIGQSKVTLGGQSATKVVVGWEIGYQVAYNFVEANNHIFEIQVVNDNDDAQAVIQTIRFAE